MPTKKQSQKKVAKVPKKLKGVKSKEPKFKLVSYTMKAVIPTGQYANIQPEITVEAETLEQAERAVMPYLETLFARYRDGGVRPIEPVRPAVLGNVVMRPVPVTPNAPVATAPIAPAPKPQSAPVSAPVASVAPAVPVAKATPVAPTAIVLTVPYTRAKSALETCTSLAALKLISDQVEKSTKLVEAEKVELRKLAATKLVQLNGSSA